MKLKDELLEFAKNNELLRRETLKIFDLIKPKIKDVADAQIIQSYLEKPAFYWKDDINIIIEFAKKYKIKNWLNDYWKKYLETEKLLLSKKDNFEKLGLKDLSFGPYSIKANIKDTIVSIEINLEYQSLEISIFPEREEDYSENFKKFEEELKTEIEHLLDTTIT